MEGSCQRLCQSLGGEVHRLALQVQVLEESDTHAIEAEAVRALSLLVSSRLSISFPFITWYSLLKAS